MTTRYWIGGTGNWSTTSHWSASSGGATDNTLPTSADDVHFDAGSNTTNAGYTVTVDATANCKDLMFDAKPGDGAGGTITFGGSNWDVNVFGNVVLLSGMTYSTTLWTQKTSGTQTITSNGVSISGANITFNAAGTVQLLDDLLFYGGTFRSIGGGTLDPNGFTVHLTGWDAHITSGSFTFFNLTRTCPVAAGKTATLTLYANQTITGTLTVTGNSATNRLLVQSDTLGTARTITAAAVSISNADFMDITGAGAAAPFTGTSLGNCLGNSGITFTTAAPQYWYSPNATAGQTFTWSTAGNWFLGSGGTGGAGRVPLPQDNVIFDSASIRAATTTVNPDMPRWGKDITWTGVTNSPTWHSNANGNYSFFGDLTAAGVSLSLLQASYLTIGKRGTCNISMGGGVIGVPDAVFVSSAGCTLNLLDALTITGTGNVLSTYNGGITTNGYALTCETLSSRPGSGQTATFDFGASLVTLTGARGSTQYFDFLPQGGTLNVTAGTSTIKLTDATATTKTFAGGGKTYNQVWLSGAGSGAFHFTGSNTFNDIEVSDLPKNVKFTAATTTTLTTFTAPAYNVADTKFVRLPGVAGSYFSTPDSAANSVTGDIDIRVKAVLDDWMPATYKVLVGKWTGAPQLSYQLYIGNAGNGVLSFATTADGSTVRLASSTVGVPFADGDTGWVRVTRASSTGATNFYTSTDGVTWSQLGASDIATTAGAIADTTSAVEIGIQNGSAAPFDNDIYRAQVLNGIDGTVVVDFNPADWLYGNTWTSSATGEVWTRNGDALIYPEIKISSITAATHTLAMPPGAPPISLRKANISYSIAT